MPPCHLPFADAKRVFLALLSGALPGRPAASAPRLYAPAAAATGGGLPGTTAGEGMAAAGAPVSEGGAPACAFPPFEFLLSSLSKPARETIASLLTLEHGVHLSWPGVEVLNLVVHCTHTLSISTSGCFFFAFSLLFSTLVAVATSASSDASSDGAPPLPVAALANERRRASAGELRIALPSVAGDG